MAFSWIWVVYRFAMESIEQPICIPHMEYVKQNIPQMECAGWHFGGMANNVLEKELALFLQRKRGSQTYAQFSKKIGVTSSTLFRIEQCQQSITLRTLQQIMDRLGCTLAEIFPHALRR